MFSKVIEKHCDFRMIRSTGSLPNGKSTAVEWFHIYQISKRYLISGQVTQGCCQVWAVWFESFLSAGKHPPRNRDGFAKATLLSQEGSPVFLNGERAGVILP